MAKFWHSAQDLCYTECSLLDTQHKIYVIQSAAWVIYCYAECRSAECCGSYTSVAF